MRPVQLLSLAWRESRFARSRLFLFLSAISLGVGALVSVQGFASNMQRELHGQARAILGADLQLSSRQPFGPLTTEILDSIARSEAQVTRVTSFASMALHRESGATRLVQVRAAEPGFPFYGRIETNPAGEWQRLHSGRNLVADPALLVALGAEIGDSVSIGETSFRISGQLQRMPGDFEVASSFAPRVFIPAAHLGETELMGYGARVDYEAFIGVSDPAAAELIDDEYQAVWRAERVRARTVEDQQERMEEALGSLAGYLGLVGVFALLLGGIGVASAMSAYMARKVDSIAVLRCIGATSRQVFGIYLLQAATMGLAGAALGVLIGGSVQWVLPRMLSGLLPVEVDVRLDGTAMLTGLLVGLWTAVGFALLPLLQIRSVSPLGAMRSRVEPLRVPARDPLRIGVWVMLIGSVFVLILYQAHEADVGLGIAAGVAGSLLVLWGAARLATWAVGRVPRTRLPYLFAQGIANLHRPGNQTVTVVLALGFGVFLLGTLIVSHSSILRPLLVDVDRRGNLIFIDVQPDQVGDLEDLLAARGAPVLQSVALVPMRVAAVRGEPVTRFTGSTREELEEMEAQQDEAGSTGPSGWAVRREYRSTYRDTLTASETLVEGRWWDPGQSADGGPFEVSLEAEVAEELGVGVGDEIVWDVQGVEVPTVVTSLREVDWARLEPNFFAVFEPDALRAAPQMGVLIARAEAPNTRAALQRDVVSRHPNVTAVDLALVQQALDEIVARVSLVIRFLAAFSVLTGFVVLLGAVATGRLQRIREAVLLKTLGATRRQIGAILLTEYAALGALAVVVGVVLSIAAGWGLATFVFEVPLAAEALPLAALSALITLLSVCVGLAASRETFRSTPMEALRED